MHHHRSPSRQRYPDLVNNKPIRKHALVNGDVITIGKHQLKYINELATAAPSDEFEKTMVIRPDQMGMPEHEGGRKVDESVSRISAELSESLKASEAATQAPPKEASLKILNGNNAGKELKLTKALTTIGKPGTQVTAINRRPQGFFIMHVEGDAMQRHTRAVRAMKLQAVNFHPRSLLRHGLRYFLGALLITLFLLHVRGDLRLPLLQQFDYLIYDLQLNLTAPRTVDRRIIIADIDEYSLSKLGHWPWRRDVLARILDRLFDDYGVRVVGFDISFPEAFDPSARRLLAELARDRLRDDPAFQAAWRELAPQLDSDHRFAESMKGRAVVLGHIFRARVQRNEPREIGSLPPPLRNLDKNTRKRLGVPRPEGYTGTCFRRIVANSTRVSPLPCCAPPTISRPIRCGCRSCPTTNAATTAYMPWNRFRWANSASRWTTAVRRWCPTVAPSTAFPMYQWPTSTTAAHPAICSRGLLYWSAPQPRV